MIYDQSDDVFIIQESKNASEGFLPTLPDIQDGLFKLILYSNLDSLSLDLKNVRFKTRLKLTGKQVNHSILLPCEQNALDNFLDFHQGNYSGKEAEILNNLNMEALNNKNLEIQISSN